MDELFQCALNSIDIGVIITDAQQNILLWNKYMEKITHLWAEDVTNKKLTDICETFKKSIYQSMLKAAIENNQSRFCSSKLHKAFVFPAGSQNNDQIRQNMKLVPISIKGTTYVMLQIEDITAQVTNETKLTSLINELKKGYLEVKESEKANRILAETDQLTGLANRAGILQKINGLINGYEKIKGAVMFLDLDGFKNINDTYGHIVGDNFLVEVSKRLMAKLRKDDIIARMGGDEFVVMLNSVATPQAAMVVGEKILQEISAPFIIDGNSLSVTVSIGIKMLDKKIKSATEAIKLADKAMYRSKNQGKNRCSIYKSDLS